MLTKNTISFAYATARDVIKDYGRDVAPRGLPTREMNGLTVLTTDGFCTVLRKGMSLRLAMMEALLIVAGEFNFDYIKAVAPNTDPKLWERQSDYGPRLAEQVSEIRELLRLDPTSRRAVAYLNTPETADEDMACSSSIQWLVRGADLEMFVNLRSWDLVYGFPVDILTHSFLNQCLALSLGLNCGPVTFSSPSLHMYASTAELAQPLGSVKFWQNDFSYGQPWWQFQERASEFAYEYSRKPKGEPQGILVAKLYDKVPDHG